MMPVLVSHCCSEDAMKEVDPDIDVERPPDELASQGLPPELFGPAGSFATLFSSIYTAAFVRQNIELSKSMFDIFIGNSDFEPDARDPRFQDAAWSENPVYKRIGQAYLAMTDAMQAMIPEDLEGDEKARAELATSIVTSAFSPTNALAGNPAAMRKALATGGSSLASGFGKFVNDWLFNDGLPQQVDDSALKVGETLGITPGKVVLKTQMFELIHYQPVCKTVHEIPTLLIPPQISRFYFTDLAPGRSFAEYALSRRLNHFVVSWRNPTEEHCDWDLEAYVRAALEATEAVAEITGQQKVNLIGFCAGGILSALVASYLAAKKRDLINTLTLCVTMLNWKVDAALGAFRLPALLDVAQAQSKARGILPGKDLHKVFTWLRPNDLVWNYWVNNYLMGDEPPAFDILAWNKDGANLPAALHADFLKIFEENKLIEPRAFEVLGEPVNLGEITCDSFVVGAETDHLTPWKACYQSCSLLGGNSQFALSNGGHIAALVNPPGNAKAHYRIGPGTAEDADTWKAKARKTGGSWWEGWGKWVSSRSGKKIKAPKQLGAKNFVPGSNAPGEYVLQ